MNWNLDSYIEIFGAVTGIIYVFLEIRQNRLLWPVGIVTSAVYIWVFFTGRLYADMGLQVYYLVISVLGWYWWVRGTGHRAQSAELSQVVSPFEEPVPVYREGKGDVRSEKNSDNTGLLKVSRLKFRTGIKLLIVVVLIFTFMWYLLDRFTDSPVPAADSFITSLSIIATWMLARKIYEHWYLWLVVNSFASVLFLTRELYPTVILYMVYFIMSFAGLIAWRRGLPQPSR